MEAKSWSWLLQRVLTGTDGAWNGTLQSASLFTWFKFQLSIPEVGNSSTILCARVEPKLQGKRRLDRGLVSAWENEMLGPCLVDYWVGVSGRSLLMKNIWPLGKLSNSNYFKLQESLTHRLLCLDRKDNILITQSGGWSTGFGAAVLQVSGIWTG